jgi:hypothetical protein
LIILTSFSDIVNFSDHKVYSISDKQPSDLQLSEIKYDRLSIFVPVDLLGLDCSDFRNKYSEYLINNLDEIKKVVRDILFSSVDTGVLLCCWCSDNFHKREEFFCHRIVIKDFMDTYLSYIQVELRGV